MRSGWAKFSRSRFPVPGLTFQHIAPRALLRTQRATLDMADVREYFVSLRERLGLMTPCCQPAEHVYAEVGTVVPPDDSRDPPEVLDDLMTAVDVGTVVCHLFDDVSHAPGRDKVGAIDLTVLRSIRSR